MAKYIARESRGFKETNKDDIFQVVKSIENSYEMLKSIALKESSEDIPVISLLDYVFKLNMKKIKSCIKKKAV